MKRYLLLFILVSLCLCGCTTISDRIYTICYRDSNSTICYDEAGNLYSYVDGRVYPVTFASFESNPVLIIGSSYQDYELKESLPNCYPLNKRQFYKLVSDLAMQNSYSVTKASTYSIDIVIDTDNYSVKLYYDANMELCRAYAIDNQGEALLITQILESD